MALSLDRQNQYRAQFARLTPGWRPASLVYEALVREAALHGTRVLDLGCGRGGVLEQLGAAARSPVGLDPDLDSLREHRLPTLPRAEAFADAIPLRDACCDVVVCSWVVEHLDDPARVFAEIRRVLAPGGQAIFLTPNRASLVVMLNRLLRPAQKWLVKRLYARDETDTFPIRYRANTPAQVAALARQAGLHLQALHQIPDPTYLAFTPWLFRLSIAITKLTPPVHLIGVLQREAIQS